MAHAPPSAQDAGSVLLSTSDIGVEDTQMEKGAGVGTFEEGRLKV